MWAYVCVGGGKKTLFVPEEYVFFYVCTVDLFPDAAELNLKS